MVFDQAIERPVNLRPQFEVIGTVSKRLDTKVNSLMETPGFSECLYVYPCHWKTDLIVSTESGLLHVNGRTLEASPCLSKLISSPTRSSWLRATAIAKRYEVSVADTTFQLICPKRDRVCRSKAAASGE